MERQMDGCFLWRYTVYPSCSNLFVFLWYNLPPPQGVWVWFQNTVPTFSAQLNLFWFLAVQNPLFSPHNWLTRGFIAATAPAQTSSGPVQNFCFAICVVLRGVSKGRETKAARVHNELVLFPAPCSKAQIVFSFAEFCSSAIAITNASCVITLCERFSAGSTRSFAVYICYTWKCEAKILLKLKALRFGPELPFRKLKFCLCPVLYKLLVFIHV